MIEYQCKMCGAKMFSKTDQHKKMFCSKKCHGAFKSLKRDEMQGLQTEPEMGRLQTIHDQGVVNLIAAIVGRAREDVLHYPPSSYYRIDAERFFESDYFAVLTELDGKTILRKLQAEYQRRKKKEGKKIDPK